jgi:hypothetical protein
MAKQFSSNTPLQLDAKPGDIGVVQVVSVTGTVSLEGSINGGSDWTEIQAFTAPAINAVVLTGSMRVTDGAGGVPTADVWVGK